MACWAGVRSAVCRDLADQRGVGGVPGRAPDLDGDPAAGDGQPDQDLGEVVAAVLGLAEDAEPGHRRVLLIGLALVPVGLAPVLAAWSGAVLVPEERLVFRVCLEVGRGGVEEEQVWSSR